MNIYQAIMVVMSYLALVYLTYRLWKWDSDSFPTIFVAFACALITTMAIGIGMAALFKYLGTL